MNWKPWRRRASGKDFEAEVEAHVQMAIRDRMAAGESLQEARTHVLREFGNRRAYGEDVRAIWGWTNLEMLVRDVRFALRLIGRSKALSATSVLLLGTSIGLVCSSFTVLDAVLVRHLPVQNPDELVLVSGAIEFPRPSLTGEVFDYVAAERDLVSHVFGSRDLLLGGTVGGVTGSIQVSGVKGDYFSGFGVDPELGRFFAAEETDPAAVISYRLWQDRFGGDPEILGTAITLGTSVIPIVGVAQEEFVGLRFEAPFDVLLPWQTFHDVRDPDGAATFPIETLARLRPGVSAEEYESQINAIWPAILEATVPPGQTLEAWVERRASEVRMDPVNQGVSYLLEATPGLSQAITMTFFLALLIFAAACLTLALLAIARGMRRRPQTVIQRAIGGTPGRIMRPSLIEHFFLSALGLGLGLVLASWGSAMGASFVPGDAWQIAPDATTVGIAATMAFVTAVIGGIFAVVVSSGGPLHDVIRQGYHVSKPHIRLRMGLLALQMGMSLVLVSFAILYVDKLADLARVEVGFDPDELRVFGLNGLLPPRELGEEYFRTLETDVSGLPGVDAVGFSLGAPPLDYLQDLREPIVSADGQEILASEQCIFPGTLEALDVPLVRGRSLTWSDTGVALVTESVAGALYSEGNVLGRSVRTASFEEPLQVVGVTGDVSYHGLRLGSRPILWVPCFGTYDAIPSGFAVNIFVRSSRGLADLQPDVRDIVGRQGTHYIYRMENQDDIVAGSIQQESTLASVSGVFGGLVVVLTGVGLYAFSSALLVFRRKELAIRSCLGADRKRVAGTMLRETLLVLILGIGFGSVVTIVGQSILSSMVVGVESVTSAIVALGVIIIVCVTITATSVPAIRATRIDLTSALRTD